MQKHKLLEVYNSDPEVQVWFRKIWSLSLVPHNKIVETYEKIRDDVPVYEEEDEDNGAGEQLNLGFRNYLYYLEKTWIGFNLIRPGVTRLGIRGAPRDTLGAPGTTEMICWSPGRLPATKVNLTTPAQR
jgi:hypothetical protein